MSDITAKIKLDYSGFVGAMQRVDAALVGAQRRAIALQTGFGGLISVFGQIGVVGGQLKDALDFGGKISDLAAASGASAGAVTIFQQAVINAGMGAEQAGSMIARMQKAIAGVNEDGQSTSDVFSRLGINIQSLASMDLLSQMQTLSAAFGRVGDVNERAALAMQLFGRAGKDMLVLLRDGTALDVASQQVGGLADTMDAASGKFDSLSDALGALGTKSTQFFSAMAAAMTEGTTAADALNSIDLTGWGAAVGESLKAVGTAVSSVSGAFSALLPALVALAGAKGMLALKSMQLGSILGGSVTNSLRIVQQQLWSTAASAAAGGLSLATVGRVGMTAFTSLAASARAAGVAIMSAFGPVGLVLMAATAIMEKVLGDLAKAKALEASVRQNARSNVRDVERNATTIKGISSESERAAALDDVEGQMERQRDMLADLEEGDEERRRQIEGQLRILEIQRNQILNVAAATMQANAAEKARAKSIAEAAENEAKLAEEKQKSAERQQEEKVRLRKGSLSDLAKWRADQEMANAESPDEKRKILMSRSGFGSTAEIDARIAELEKLLSLGNASTTEAEAAELNRLTDLRGGIAGIDRDKAREQAKASAAAVQSEIDDKAARAKDLLNYNPQQQIWADSARSIGLGGNAATNQQEIARVQAERQREANTLLREIRDSLKRNPTATAPADFVFS